MTGQTSLTPQKLKNISTTEEKSRIVTGISELTVYWAAALSSSAALRSSAASRASANPRFAAALRRGQQNQNVFYVTGEESVRQIKLRAARLNVPEDNIFRWWQKATWTRSAV